MSRRQQRELEKGKRESQKGPEAGKAAARHCFDAERRVRTLHWLNDLLASTIDNYQVQEEPQGVSVDVIEEAYF